MAQSGTDCLVLVNTGTPSVPSYEVMASQRDASFDEATAAIDISSKDSRARRVLPGRYTHDVSLNGLYVPSDAAYQALQDAMRNGELILIAKQNNGVVTETMDAVILTLSEKEPDQTEATIDATFAIDGFPTEVSS